MKIHLSNKQQDLVIDKLKIQKALVSLARFLDVTFDEMSVHFVTERKIKELHQTFFNDPTITDCITLPIDPPGTQPYCLLGEVFVCAKVALDYAKSTQSNPKRELLLYVVHGFLHLIGYDDMEEDDEQKMREMEKLALEHLTRDGLCSL